MPKYDITLEVIGYYLTTIEAEDAETAASKAEEELFSKKSENSYALSILDEVDATCENIEELEEPEPDGEELSEEDLPENESED